MPQVHHYCRETGLYLGSSEAAPDPLEHKIRQDEARDAILAPARAALSAAKDSYAREIARLGSVYHGATEAGRKAELEARLAAEAAHATAVAVAMEEFRASKDEGREEKRDAALLKATSDLVAARSAGEDAYQEVAAEAEKAYLAAHAEADAVLKAAQDAFAKAEQEAEVAAAAVEPEIWLEPAHATLKPLPKLGKGKVAKFDGKAWSAIAAPAPEAAAPAAEG